MRYISKLRILFAIICDHRIRYRIRCGMRYRMRFLNYKDENSKFSSRWNLLFLRLILRDIAAKFYDIVCYYLRFFWVGKRSGPRLLSTVPWGMTRILIFVKFRKLWGLDFPTVTKTQLKKIDWDTFQQDYLVWMFLITSKYI